MIIIMLELHTIIIVCTIISSIIMIIIITFNPGAVVRLTYYIFVSIRLYNLHFVKHICKALNLAENSQTFF